MRITIQREINIYLVNCRQKFDLSSENTAMSNERKEQQYHPIVPTSHRRIETVKGH